MPRLHTVIYYGPYTGEGFHKRWAKRGTPWLRLINLVTSSDDDTEDDYDVDYDDTMDMYDGFNSSSGSEDWFGASYNVRHGSDYDYASDTSGW